ncbi:MAG: helix-turn-helix transcriptional regulator [Acidobacteriota bacterium]|nr:helix-turn-helix transcriptional regulator [Acidobacteriota bacterium]
MYLRDRDLQAVARLWHELAEFPAARADAAREHCLTALVQILGATNAFWVGTTRTVPVVADDPLHGWRPRADQTLHRDEARDRLIRQLLRQMERQVVDPHTAAIAARAGTTRAFLRPELVPDDEWRQSWLASEMFPTLGISDRMVGANAVHPSAESYIGLDRGPGDKPFSRRERDLLYAFLLGSSPFHREQLQVHRLIGPSLTPREREVLHLLLTDLTERQIADRLGLTPRTTHQYVVSVLKKLGVSGRIGLMALWLRRAPASEQG